MDLFLSLKYLYYVLYIIHAGFVVTSGGIKRCWFPCLKSEMTNQFDNVFELTDMTFQLRWALMKKASFLTYFANMSIFFQMEEPSTD